jgi:transposase
MHRGERLGTMDIQAILRAVRAGKSDRYIADNLGVDRRTVSKYRRILKGQDLLTGELPDLGALHRLLAEQLPRKGKGRPSSIGTWAQPIQHDVERGLTPRLIYQKLCEDPRFTASESAVYRYVRKLRPPAVQATIRVETPPGQEGQVDFGKVGQLWDAATQTLRSAWIFTLLLSWSRHMYVEFVFDQKVETWLSCHRHAFEFLGGAPARLKIDNLKAGITQACFDDPQVQRAYAECAEHYGFRIDPCRPYKPEHKGKVERGAVSYVKRSFVPLLPEGCTPSQANAQVREWIEETAGQREHGTTHVAPLVRFAEEKGHLQPLPSAPFEPSVWKQVKLYRDCHVVFEKSYYSAPFRLLEQPLQLRATPKQVELYDRDFRLVATHSRATTAGERHTLTDHLPPEKVAGLVRSRAELLQAAQCVGPYTAQVAQQLLEERPLERSQMVQRILRLADRYDAARLEAACARGLSFDDVRYRTLKRILQQGLERSPVPQFPTADGGTLVYARTQEEFATAFMTLARGGAG